MKNNQQPIWQQLSSKPYLLLLGLILFFINPLLLLGVIIFILIFIKLISLKNMVQENIVNVSLRKNRKFFYLIFLGLIIIALLAKMVAIIPAGETGIIDLFGQVSDKEISSGIHLINPLARVTKMSIRTEEYTMTIAPRELAKETEQDSIDALTKEGLMVTLDLTILYHLQEDKASDVYKNIGINYEEKIIRPQIRTSIREIVALYEAKDIYSEKRLDLQDQILTHLKNAIEPRGIIIESLLLRNVILPEKLSNSIQEKLTAEQEAQKYSFILEKEKKEAERKKLEAQGQRDAQAIINESLTDKYLYYLYIKELKDRPGTIYVPVSPDNGMPLFKNITP